MFDQVIAQQVIAQWFCGCFILNDKKQQFNSIFCLNVCWTYCGSLKKQKNIPLPFKITSYSILSFSMQQYVTLYKVMSCKMPLWNLG